MPQVDYAALQQRYGGQYVASRDGQVFASGHTYDELMDRLEQAPIDWSQIVIGYVDPPDVICVY